MSLDKLEPAFHEKKPGSPRVTTRVAISAPASLGVLLLAGAVAFGHTAGFFNSTTDGDAGAAVATSAADEPAATVAKPDRTAKPSEAEEAPKKDSVADEELALAQRTPKPQPVEEAPKPEPEPEPEPEPAKYVEPVPQPAPPTAVLSLVADQASYPGKVVLSWTAFTGAGFEYYKVVRSTDGDATWPGSGADELIAAIGNPGETWAKDRPPCGTTAWYRVFAVRHGAYGYEVLAPSNQVSAIVECPPPPPATVGIGLSASLVDGKVQLSWGSCPSEHVNAFKIVRSPTNPEPMYPENEGTQLIAAVGPDQTTFADRDVASGQTWFYRVLARADNGGGTFIACQSNAVSVTIP